MKSIKSIPRETSNSEIENSEMAIFPSLVTVEAKGSRHSSDINNPKGIPTILPENTRILSHHLKADKELVKNLVGKDKKMSFADMGKMYNTIPELTILMNPKEDDLAKKTAQLMLTKKAAQLDGIFEGQEAQKEQTSMNTLDDILGKVSVFKKGGKKGKDDMPKYQMGNQVPMTYGNLGLGNIPNYARLRTDPIYTKNQLFTQEPMVQQNLFPQTLFNDKRVGSYQKQAIAWDASTGYRKSPLDLAVRRETVKHLFDDKGLENWKHIDVFDDKGNPIIQGGKRLVSSVPEGDFTFNERTNALGEKVPSYIDNDNDHYQVPMYQTQGYDATPDTPNYSPSRDLPALPPITFPLNPIPVPNNRPPITKEVLPTPTQPQTKKPFDDLYGMTQLRDIVDLATLDVRPPAYNYKPQNIAYTRYLPQNTLEGERQYNVMKQQVENSNMPESAKAAYLNDLQAKLQDNSSRVMLQNVQSDNQNDNSNISLYNQVTNQNRSDRINYDDKNTELNDRLLFNYGQEKLRLQDQLINNYGKHKQNNLMLGLVNQLGENFYFDGQQVQYIPGKGTKNLSDPLQAYQQSQIQQLLKDLNAATSSVDKKNIADAIKSLQGK